MHDVVIVGAGPGGSATAHYLSQRGLNVLLLDKADFPRDKTCGDGLTPRAVDVLTDMGLLDELLRVGRRINQFEVIAPNRNVTRAPIPIDGDSGERGLSLVVPRRILDEKIMRRAVESGVMFEPNVHVTNIERDENGVAVKGEYKGRAVSYTGRMAVVATGAHVKLLTQMGMLKRMPNVFVASRAYFESVQGLSDCWTLRFDSVPLPGYGWIFPVAKDRANIGVGYFSTRRTTSATNAFHRFVQSPPLRRMLASAKQVGPVKGFPLRSDFTAAPTYTDRVLLVGEAAGLVNPLTGEGIDYALESGRLAAQHLAGMFERGDFTRTQHEAYDTLLRGQFQTLFEFCERVRDLSLNRHVLNILVSMANRRDDLRLRLASVVLGKAPVTGKITARRIVRVLIRRR